MVSQPHPVAMPCNTHIASVTLSREIQIPSGNVEGPGELLVESSKLQSKFDLVRDVRYALRKPDSNRLLDYSNINSRSHTLRMFSDNVRTVSCIFVLGSKCKEGLVTGFAKTRHATGHDTLDKVCRHESDVPQSILVRFTHEYGLSVGARVPDSHVKGPFSVRSPLKLEHPGPPLNQMAISSFGSECVVGKNLGARISN